MSLALLLAAAGKEVTLVEANAAPGGLMRRFRRDGVPFDTGFHFTGGFDNILGQLLRLLGIADCVREAPFGMTACLGPDRETFEFPAGGIGAVEAALAARFPAEAAGIRRYFEIERGIIARTPMYNLADLSPLRFGFGDPYDTQTLGALFAELRLSPRLRTLLGCAATCYGSAPSECSVNTHCRVAYGFDDRISEVAGGGDAFIAGFRREAARLGVRLVTGARVARALDSGRRQCHRVLLSTGEELAFGNAFFAIHPASIAALIPPEDFLPLYREKFAACRDTCTFFSVYGLVDPAARVAPRLTSYLSEPDLDKILLPPGAARATGIVVTRAARAGGGDCLTLNAFSTAYPAEAVRWQGLTHAERLADSGYQDYKAARREAILADVYAARPELRGHVTVLATASPLTFRDYDPPGRGAYGIRQRAAGPRMMGRLPVRNWYLAGQSALVPGVVGTLMSSALLAREAMGEAAYAKLVHERLGA